MHRLALAVLFLVVPIATAQNLALREVISGLSQPLGLVNAGDSRLFVVQQGGKIMIWNGTRVLSTPFLDVTGLISCCGERGLLGLAFDPHYAQNGFFFIDYTQTNGNIAIARYHVSSNTDVADASSGIVLLTITHTQFSNHNGGQLQFGPDGYLYVGVGDGGSGGDPNNNAQNRSALLGKLLRLDVSTIPVAIPASNPFGNLVWAYGLRNPWRFSFDRETGDLWIADVGQDAFEEIDFQSRTSIGGENYGWRRMEGFHCFNPASNCADASFTAPVVEYSHADGSCSVTGGYRYRGKFIRMRGIYFYADYCTGVIWAAEQQPNGSWVGTRRLSTNLKIRSFGEDMYGEMYVVAENGSVYQLIDQLPPRRRAVASR